MKLFMKSLPFMNENGEMKFIECRRKNQSIYNLANIVFVEDKNYI